MSFVVIDHNEMHRVVGLEEKHLIETFFEEGGQWEQDTSRMKSQERQFVITAFENVLISYKEGCNLRFIAETKYGFVFEETK